jgi:acyl carrier protein
VTETETQTLTTGQVVRGILAQHGRFSVENLGDGDSLYAAGLTSLATVSVMLALEDRFDVEFPESMLNRATFASIDSIAEAVTQLMA